MIVLDTNVIVSALVFGGLPRLILDLAAKEIYQMFYSSPIQEEVKRVLHEKFGWDAGEITKRTNLLFAWAGKIHPQISLAIIKDDPDDDRILECALAAEAKIIISGDRHLLRLQSFQSIVICTPRQFLDDQLWIKE